METTLFLIGGPARVGKSAVARALAARVGIGWVSADVLSAVIEAAGVELASRWSVADAREQGERFFPFLRRFASASHAFHGSYCLEGISILPEHVANIVTEGFRVRACFLGDESMTADRIVAYARGFLPDGPGRSMHRWVEELSEAVLLEYAESIRAVSAFFRRESEAVGFPYVDMGKSFDGGVQHAVSLLVSDAT